MKTKNGEYRLVVSHGKAVWNEQGNPIRMAGSHTDITDQIYLEEQLNQEKKLSESIVKEAPMLIVVMDREGKLKEFNPFAEKLLGYKKEEVLHKNILNQVLLSDEKESLDQLIEQDWSKKRLPTYELNIICKDGHMVATVWRAKILYDTEKKVESIVAIGIDITEKRMIQDRLHTLAYYDRLTQLPNRTLFEERVYQEIQRAEQEEIGLALVYLDIDNFKHINDTMGHQVGDQLLIHIAQILATEVQPPHSIARLGGDEFAILLENAQNSEQVIEYIKGLLETIKKPWMIDGKEFYVTISVGIAVYPEHGKDFIHLMQSADTAVFNTKENGKDGICVFEADMREKTWKYMEMANHLRIAIQNREFELYYQPQIALATGKIIGVEALIRWKHPTKGFISPMEFIPFAEETGKIAEITDWVFNTACMQSKEWENAGHTELKMSINLSSKLLTQKGLVESIKKLIENSYIKNPQLEIEITETAVVANLEKAIEVLWELKGLGATIALDDFGTGYSSLTYLQKLPIDILKVDREFIRNVVKEDEECYIFNTIVDLAHKLGLKVVAEGVETKEQLAFLVHSGCDIGQGYYFSKPLPKEEIDTFFLQYKPKMLI
jgi:diguanylate cyclase (GGDEF)-like protein/PAS domain S-box-containing protein